MAVLYVLAFRFAQNDRSRRALSVAESLPAGRGAEAAGPLENAGQVLLVRKAASKPDLGNGRFGFGEPLFGILNSPPQ